MTEQAGVEFHPERLQICLAEQRDYPAIAVLFREGLIEGQLRSNDTGADIDNIHAGYFSDEGASAFWVARYDDEVVGMIGVQHTAESVGEIRRLRVRHDFRRRGIGAKLMEQAVGFCREHGYLKVILDVRIEREPAIKLFEKFGFAHSRSRDIEGRKMLDFYLDLYREPGS